MSQTEEHLHDFGGALPNGDSASLDTPVGMIRLADRFEGIPNMTGLSAAFLATFVPQAPGFLLHPIARGRFTAVPAVFGKLIFQTLNPLR